MAKEQITALPPSPFENTLPAGRWASEKAKELGNPKNTSDLKGKESDLKISGFPECEKRIDCLLGVEKTYGLNFGDFVASEEKYDVIDNGSADVIFGFTTDGELTTGKYVKVEDDKNFFPPYNVSLMMRNDTFKEIGPEGQKVIEDVQKPLTEKVMQELNSRVDLDKQEPEEGRDGLPPRRRIHQVGQEGRGLAMRWALAVLAVLLAAGAGFGAGVLIASEEEIRDERGRVIEPTRVDVVDLRVGTACAAWRVASRSRSRPFPAARPTRERCGRGCSCPTAGGPAPRGCWH